MLFFVRVDRMKPAPKNPSEDQDSLLSFVENDGDRDVMEGLEGPGNTEKLLDADFFNKFDDDFDEDDMAIP